MCRLFALLLSAVIALAATGCGGASSSIPRPKPAAVHASELQICTSSTKRAATSADKKVAAPAQTRVLESAQRGTSSLCQCPWGYASDPTGATCSTCTWPDVCPPVCDPTIDPSCGTCIVGCQPPPPPPPTPAPPPYATYPEIPDDPDGPGHGPLPNLNLPEDLACPDGWSLAYSNGSGGNPVGGAYCGAIASADVVGTYTVSTITYQTSHYWNRHLACYVHNAYTSAGWNLGLIGPDFQGRPNKPVSAQSVEFTGLTPITDNSGVSTQWAYRISLIGSMSTGLVTANAYNVGTSFLKPRRVDCPKPYPNYP
jgi:hypothetical protein